MTDTNTSGEAFAKALDATIARSSDAVKAACGLSTTSGADVLASFNAMTDLAKAHLCRADIGDAAKEVFRTKVQGAEKSWHAIAALIEREAAQVAELANIRRMAEQAAREYVDHRRANESERDALAAEVKALRADAERLSWLDAQNISKRMGWKVNVAPVGNVSVQSVIFLRSEPVTIRQAIDAARASAATGGGNG